MMLKQEIFKKMHNVILLIVSSTLPASQQQPPLTPNKKTDQHSPPSNILQSYNRQMNADNDKFKQEEVSPIQFKIKL